jgi:hypothetical protein
MSVYQLSPDKEAKMVDEEWVPGNMSELLASIQHEWKLLMEAVAKLDESKTTAPDAGGWSPRDNLAHLGEWMNVLMGYHLDHRPSHEVLKMSEETVQDWDFNIINGMLFERNRNRSTQDVLNELRSVYETLLEKLKAMSFDDLLKPRHADDPEKRPVLMWVLGNTTHHFAEHRATIEKNDP